MEKILSTVPIRRLIQYKCVSKTWLHTISHHIHPNLLSINQEPGFIVIQTPFRTGSSSTRFSFNLREGGVKPKSIDNAPFELFFSDLVSYQSSCNGLICLKQYLHYSKWNNNIKYRIIICNPYLLEVTALPNIINDSSSSSAIPLLAQQQQHQHVKLPTYNENYGLGFSPPTNQYKVVRLTWYTQDCSEPDMIYRLSYRKNKSNGSITSYNHYRRPKEIKVLTLGGGTGTDQSWRDVSSVPLYPIHGTPVYANGSLYWLVNRTTHYSVKSSCIVSFDVEKEKFYITSQPTECTGLVIQLINLRGCLAVVENRVGGKNLAIWRLNNNNNNLQQQQQQQQQWIREYSIEICYLMISVIGLWEHGEILCFQSHPETLISYDPKTNKKRYICIRSGFGSEFTGVRRHVIHAHTGSLVSLKAYGYKTWRIAPGKIHSNLYDLDATLSKLGVSTRVQLLTQYPV